MPIQPKYQLFRDGLNRSDLIRSGFMMLALIQDVKKRVRIISVVNIASLSSINVVNDIYFKFNLLILLVQFGLLLLIKVQIYFLSKLQWNHFFQCLTNN